MLIKYDGHLRLCTEQCIKFHPAAFDLVSTASAELNTDSEIVAKAHFQYFYLFMYYFILSLSAPLL